MCHTLLLMYWTCVLILTYYPLLLCGLLNFISTTIWAPLFEKTCRGPHRAMSRLTHDKLAALGPSAPHERTYVVLTGAGSSPATVARLRAQLSWRDDLFVDLTTSFVVDDGEEPVTVHNFL